MTAAEREQLIAAHWDKLAGEAAGEAEAAACRRRAAKHRHNARCLREVAGELLEIARTGQVDHTSVQCP